MKVCFNLSVDEDFDEDEDENEAGNSGRMEGIDEDEEQPPPREELPDDSLQTFDMHSDAIMSVAWNTAMPNMVATGSCDDRAFIWRVGSSGALQFCLPVIPF